MTIDIADAKPLALVGKQHPALHSPATDCGPATGDHALLAMRMNATRTRKNGLAIAAPQVGVSLRLIVWHAGVLLDPRIVGLSGEPDIDEVEECLSLPGRYYQVPRYPRCVVTGFDLTDEFHCIEAEGLEARMFQHEIDHLDGFLACDRGPEVRWHDERRKWVLR